MKKIIAAFAAGQALQILLLFLSENLTYSDKALGFCLGVGIIVLVALIVGAWGAWFAPAAPAVPAAQQAPRQEAPKQEAPKHVAKGKAPAVPDRARLREIFPHWQIEDVQDMDEAGEIPKEIRVTNTSVVREEAPDV